MNHARTVAVLWERDTRRFTLRVPIGTNDPITARARYKVWEPTNVDAQLFADDYGVTILSDHVRVTRDGLVWDGTFNTTGP